MKIILTEKQVYKILENNFGEYTEIRTSYEDIPRLDNVKYMFHYAKNKTAPFDANDYFNNDKKLNTLSKSYYSNVGQYNFKKYHIIMENQLNIDDLYDVTYFTLPKTEDLFVELYDTDGDMALSLEMMKFGDGFSITFVNVPNKYQGRGLAIKTYLKFVEVTNKPLYSDITQTEASKKGIWEKLYKLYPNRILAYKNKKTYPVEYRDNKLMFYDEKTDSYKDIYDTSGYIAVLKLIP